MFQARETKILTLRYMPNSFIAENAVSRYLIGLLLVASRCERAVGGSRKNYDGGSNY